jgi:hypothetical protein
LVLEVNVKRVLSFLVAALLALAGIGVYFGFHLHRKASAQAELRSQYLRDPGNALPAVREGVVEELRGFQDGYIRRDPLTLDAFMSRHFENNDDILVLGAGSSEWARGYSGVSNFIRADWADWGDLRFNVENPMVSSYGDVAWVATAGTVRFKLRDRPVRFSAILTRHGDKWLFRQMHFQYEDGDESLLGLSLRR